MTQEKLKKGKWYSLYPYTGKEKDCQWWMKSYEDGSGTASVYISWFNSDKPRQFVNNRGELGGYEYTEATPKEYAWLKEVERRREYFPIEEFKFENVINDYNIY